MESRGSLWEPFHSNTPRLRLCLQPAFSTSEFSNAHWEHSNLAHKVGLICLGRTQKLRRSPSIPSLEKLEVVVGQKAVRSVDFDPGFLFLSTSNRYLFPSWAPAFHSWSIQVSVKRSESGSRFAFCGVSTGSWTISSDIKFNSKSIQKLFLPYLLSQSQLCVYSSTSDGQATESCCEEAGRTESSGSAEEMPHLWSGHPVFKKINHVSQSILLYTNIYIYDVQMWIYIYILLWCVML